MGHLAATAFLIENATSSSGCAPAGPGAAGRRHVVEPEKGLEPLAYAYKALLYQLSYSGAAPAV